FPNAEILVPAAEHKFWMDDGEMSRATPGRMQGLFKDNRRVISGEILKRTATYEWGKEIAPGINSVSTPGHTVGHTSYVIASGSARLFVFSDVTNRPELFVRNPGWHAFFDQIPDMAETTRRKVLDMLIADKMLVQTFHAPFPALGHMEKDGQGYRFVQAPWSLDKAIALPVLLHVPEGRERCVERLHEHLVGDQHVEHFSPRRFRHVRNLIEEGVPAGIAHEQLRAIGDVGKHEQPRRSRCNHVRGVANGMAGSRNRGDPRGNLPAPLVGRSALKNLAAHRAAGVLEQTLHVARGGAAHLAVVHPELVLGRRNQNFRIRECRLVIGAEQAIHMVRVVMRDDDGIDRLGVDAGAREVLLVLAV